VTHDPSDTLITTTEAAARIGISEITIRKWRWLDSPNQPPFVRLGPRSVKYRLGDLDKWLASRTHQPSGNRRSKDRSPGRHRGRPGPRG
jgi:predicted DNA-binding transcriptional regulator AlpA